MLPATRVATMGVFAGVSDQLALRAQMAGLSPSSPVGLWLRNQDSDQTRETYLRAVLAFADWLGSQRLRANIADATFEDLLSYKEHLTARELKAGTVEGHLRRLASLYSFLVDRGEIARSPARGLKLPKVRDERMKRAWASEEVWAFLAAIGKSSQDTSLLTLRDRALFGLMFRNGLRVSELAGANVGDLCIKMGHAILEIRGKGGHQGDAVLIERTFNAIRDYLAARDIAAGAVLESRDGPWRDAPLFLAIHGGGWRPSVKEPGRLSRFSINARMIAIGTAAGISRDILYPHAGRHTFASHLAALGIPLPQIQVATRHANIQTLMGYVHVQDAIINNAAKRIDF